MKLLTWIAIAFLSSCGAVFGQAGQTPPPGQTAPDAAALKAAADAEKANQAAMRLKQDEIRHRNQTIANAERDGVEVRIKDVARFRGVRANQLTGIGLVVGLQGTGDSKKTPATATLLSNYLRSAGVASDPKLMDAKNVALVTVQATLPPFAKAGSTVDVRVSSIGDAKSLQGGTLIQTPLYAAGNFDNPYVVADGGISIGGFNVESGGSKIQQNHVTVGRIPSGGIVENHVDTKIEFNGRMYLDLDAYDLTTAQRLTQRINELYPAFNAVTQDGSTVQLTIPTGSTSMAVALAIEEITILSDTAALVVINERTGTIIVGDNVRIGPALVAKGSLTVKIEEETLISQPPPFSNGTTVTAKQTTITAGQNTAKVALLPPTTTISDLAKVFQMLELDPRDIISIIQDLKSQGALKARVVIQ